MYFLQIRAITCFSRVSLKNIILKFYKINKRKYNIKRTIKVDFYSFQINLEVLHQLISLKSNGMLVEIYMANQDVKSWKWMITNHFILYSYLAYSSIIIPWLKKFLTLWLTEIIHVLYICLISCKRWAITLVKEIVD